MADITITPANVTLTGTPQRNYLAGENLTAGDSAYVSANKLYKAKASNLTLANGVGVVLNGAFANQTVGYANAGTLNLGLGANTTAGVPYVISNTSGKIAPHSDLTAGLYVTFLGVGGAGNNTIVLDVNATGIALG